MFESAERISETRRRKNPESSTTRTLTTINTPLDGARLSRPDPPESNTPCGVTLEHTRDIENQRDAAVTSDGGAGHARGSLKHFAQWLDDHFFLAHQLIDDKADPLRAHRQDHHMALALLFVSGGADQPAFEVEQGQGLIPHDHHFLAVHHVGARQVEVEDLVDVDQREGERLVAQHHHQGWHDRQGQRHLDDDLRALALGRVNVDRTIELADLGLYHVHAHATAGHVGNFGLGREARGEDQVVALGVGQAVGGVLVHHATLDRDIAQNRRVHAFAVIGDRQQDMVAFLLGRQNHLAIAGLARGFAFFRRFDAVVDGVAHQVDQRVGQGLDQVFVEVGFFTHQFQVDFFLELTSQVANQAWEAAEDFLDRLHPRFHHGGLQVSGDHVEVRHGLLHGFIAAVQAQTHQTVTHQHQFADHVHDVVQACS